MFNVLCTEAFYLNSIKQNSTEIKKFSRLFVLYSI